MGITPCPGEYNIKMFIFPDIACVNSSSHPPLFYKIYFEIPCRVVYSHRIINDRIENYGANIVFISK